MDSILQISIVRIVVKTADDRCLLLRRAADDKWLPGRYELPGGKVDLEDEDLVGAAARELQEETGLQFGPDELKLIRVVDNDAPGKQYITMVYEVTIGLPVVVVLSHEHDKLLWINTSDLSQLVLAPRTNEVIHFALNRGVSDVKDDVDAKKATNIEHLIIYTDGGSRGNPGPSAAGYVMMDENNNILEQGGEYLGITTNNQAEYQAVRVSLEKANKYHPHKITFCIDSQLVVRQMNGEYQIKNRDLWPVHARIKLLTQSYSKVAFTQVAREHNTLADAKVNEVLDAHH